MRRNQTPENGHLLRSTSILADLHDEWQATERRYLSEHSMATLCPERDIIATAELTPGH